MFDDNRIQENGAEIKPLTLKDVSQSGRKRPWRTHKLNGILLSESYKRLGQEKRAQRCEDCGSFLRFGVCQDHSYLQLTGANFCRLRLCPMCGWRKSLLTGFQVRRVCHEANGREKLRWLFLTLTVRNCKTDELAATLDKMYAGWRRFQERKVVKTAVVGWFRGLEVTRNNDRHSEWHGTYHPHFHVLLCVRQAFFKPENYLKQKDWQALWQSAMRLDYAPVVDVRAVKSKQIGEAGVSDLSELSQIEAKIKGMEAAISETAKYAAKSNDYLIYQEYEVKQEGKRKKVVPKFGSGIDEEQTDVAVDALDSALARRRLLGYGGLLKDIWSELAERGEVEDAEDVAADLVSVNGAPTGCKCPTCASDLSDTMYKWHYGVKNYVAIVK